MTCLPPRPYRLRRWFVIRIYLIAILGPLAALGGVAFSLQALVALGQTLQHEGALVATGAVAPAWVDPTPRKRGLLLHDYRLPLRFTDKDGGTQEDLAVFSSLGAEADLAQPGQVYFDPRNPTDHVLSYAVDVRLGRRLLGAAQLALAGVLLALFCAVARLELRDLRTARRCAQSSEEITVSVVRTREPWIVARGATPIVYYYRLPTRPDAPPAAEQLVVFDSRQHTPLFAEPPTTSKLRPVRQLIALRAPGGQVVVLRDDLYPFHFTDGERHAVYQRIRAAQPKLPATGGNSSRESPLQG